MKVLFWNSVPFFLAHGGAQTVTESVMRELPGLGVTVEPERWWDAGQKGDIIHYIGRPPQLTLELARKKEFKVVMTEFLDQTSSRSHRQLMLQKLIMHTARKLLPGSVSRMGWDVYRQLDAMIYTVPHEWETAKFLFNARPDRGHIVPHGLEEATLEALSQPAREQDYLVSMATIAERKNSILLAEAALLAQTPVVFLGKPYAENDDYFRRFRALVDGKFVRYPGFVTEEEKRTYLRGARGFALLSQFESGCIAVYEAAAAGLPLFLSDLPWANKVYHAARKIRFTTPSSVTAVAAELSDFYHTAHREPGLTFPMLTWHGVAKMYLAVYEQTLAV